MSTYTQVERNGLFELTDEVRAELTSSKYYNEDLAPTSVSQRTWTTYNISMLWVGMAICVPSLTLATAMIGLGISPWLSIINVALGNLIVLIPIQLNSSAGTRYGIPFPAFSRLTFGSVGAQVPAILRGIVACGWCAVQAWVGGGAFAAMIGCFVSKFNDQEWTMALPGNSATSVPNLIGFILFMLFVLWVAYNGMEQIKWVQNIGGPLLIVIMIGLLIWSIKLSSDAGYSFLQVMNQGNDEAAVSAGGGFAFVFLAGLTGNIAFWATMALNIPDFSRYARSQKDQFRGQLYGMPLPMALCAFIGAFFAQATKLSMGTDEAMFNPTGVLYFIPNKIIVFIAALGVIAATITTCVAANVVAPANGFSNISPRRISYRMGVIATCIISFLMCPWYIFSDAGGFIFGWLNNYGTVLAPIAAIFIADYYYVKKKKLDVAALYKGSDGRYWYSGGWNWAAIISWIAAFIVPILGNTVYKFDGTGTPNFIQWLAANGYIVSFIVGFVVYILLIGGKKASFVSEEEHTAMTKSA